MALGEREREREVVMGARAPAELPLRGLACVCGFSRGAWLVIRSVRDA